MQNTCTYFKSLNKYNSLATTKEQDFTQEVQTLTRKICLPSPCMFLITYRKDSIKYTIRQPHVYVLTNTVNYQQI